MKKLAVLVTTLVILLAALFIISSKEGGVNLISPLARQEKVLGINQWFPGNMDIDQTKAPSIRAEAALFVETTNGQVLFAKNPQKKLPIASLVKVMTALIALEHKGMDD